MACPVCGREFSGDPVYDYVGAQPSGDYVIPYWRVRHEWDSTGCYAVGEMHRF